jgi:LTXXQ motif family protein
MPQIKLRSAAALALILPALATNASAQDRRDQRGAGPAAPHVAPAAPAPHIAAPAPAPHIAAPAPAPHIAAPAPAPHIAAPAPHIAAPAPHIAAPAHVAPPAHVAAPAHVAPPARVAAPAHTATPHVATPQVARPNIARSNAPHPNANNANAPARGNATTGVARRGGPNAAGSKLANPNTANPNVASPNKTPNQAVSNAVSQGPGNRGRNAVNQQAQTPSNTANPNVASPNKTPNQAVPNAVGQGPGNRGRNAVNQQAQTQAQERAQAAAQARAQIYAPGHKPILRNPAFANASTRDPAMRALARATFHGNFSQLGFREKFADRRRFPGIVIGWGGPVFWPYAYQDFVDYTFYPYANDTFWPYAYDDVYDSIFGAYAPGVSAYASTSRGYAGSSSRGGRRLAARETAAAGLPPPGSAQICTGEASGLTDWPIERITQQVQPDDAQRALLDQLRDAAAKAVNLLQSNCPTDLPATPTGRLGQMRQRIQTMQQAVQLVRPTLEKFYQSLSDEQKERFIALEAEPNARGTRGARQQTNLAQACGASGKQITSLPINQIQQLLHPNDAQQVALQDLRDATAKAAAILNQNCPQDDAITPPARLAAMEMRLNAMLQALDTVQPALAKFYNSLNDEQKARFDRMPPPRTA